MSELRKVYRTTARDLESQTVVDVMFIPKVLLHELSQDGFEALRATARGFDFSMSESDLKRYDQFGSDDLATALGITPSLAEELFERNDIIAAEMSAAKMTAISALIGTGVTVGLAAAAGGP